MDEKEFRIQIAVGALQTAKLTVNDLTEILKTLQDVRMLFLLLDRFNTSIRYQSISGTTCFYRIPTNGIITSKDDLYYNIKRILVANNLRFDLNVNHSLPSVAMASLRIEIKDEDVEKWLELQQMYQQVT